MAQRLPPELENKLVRLQALQTQYNRIVQERVTVETEISETQRVLKLVEEAGENTPIYRLEANVFVKVDREKLLQELRDKIEILELRLQKLKKQEDELKKQLEELTQEIRSYQAKLSIGKQATGAG